MLTSEIEDCENCPILKEGLCTGGFAPTPNGPIEPPCASFVGDEDVYEWIKECYTSMERYEAYEEKCRKEAQEKKRKAELKKKRHSFLKAYCVAEYAKVDKIKKELKMLERSIEQAQVMSFAVNMANEMFGYNERTHLRPEVEELRDNLEAALEEAKANLAAKQKECQKTAEYKAIM